MANKKISQLTELTSASDGDFVAIVDASSTPIETKKISYTNLAGSAIAAKAPKADPTFTGTATFADVDADGVKLSDFTATSRSTNLSQLSPTQNNQPATDDTVTELCVDPSGNVVRGSQEATWTFTRAQLNSLAQGTRYDLLSAPGTDKCICVEESNWLIESDSTQSGTYEADITCEISGATVFSVATRVTASRLTTLSGSVFGGKAIYTRDVPETDKMLAFNKPMTIRIPGHNQPDNFPAKLVSAKLKIKYRVFDKATF
jgi:hypothetical protein